MPPRILIVRLSSMGDVLLTTPLIRALRERHPDATITFVTKTGFASLLVDNPRIAEVIGYDPATPLKALAERIKGGGFTHRLDLHGNLRTRWLRFMVGGIWGSYPKHRLARALLIRTKRDRYRDPRPVAERYFDAADGLGVSPSGQPLEFFVRREAMEAAQQFLSDRGLGADRQLIAVCPGAHHATKRWPLRHWQHLVTQLTTTGWDVVVLGGPAERQLGEDVAAAGAESAANAAGAFDFPGSAALLKLSRRAVSGDTGLMHLATAVQTPVVALFGPTVRQFGFYPYGGRATVLERDLPCRPCSAMGGPACPLGHHRCLVDLTPDAVFDAIRRLPR